MTGDHDREGGVLERFRLDGQVALVTGSSRGIGAGVAVALAEAGADVALVARNGASLAEVARTVRAAGRHAEPIVCDVTEGDQSTAAVAQALRALGRIDILVNNAGGPMFNASFLDTRDSGWRKVLDLNLNSVVHFCREVGRHMIERRSGSVINVTSPATIRPWPAITAYGAAKAAVLNLTQALAQEWAADGVRVNAICPGWIRTDINRAFTDSPVASAATAADVPLGRWGEPADVVGAAVWLASGAASYVTGAHITIDGGLTVAVPEDWRALRTDRTWLAGPT